MLNGIKNKIKNELSFQRVYQKFLRIISFNRGLIRNLQGRRNIIKIGTAVNFKHCKVKIQGDDNIIEIMGPGFFKNVTFNIQGNRNVVLLAANVNFVRGGVIWVEDESCKVEIGEFSTFEDVHIAVTEPGSSVLIGKDCMFAYDIDIRTGDSHSIINSLTGERINYAKNIEIGNHVWVASHVSILKGVKICDNSVVATRAVLSRPFDTKGILIGGIPAIQLKENITWDRKRL